MVANKGTNSTVGPQTNPEAEIYDQLIRNNQRRIFQLIYKIVRNRADAQDLTQDTFLLAIQRYGQIKETERSPQWLSSIARNLAISFVRRNRMRYLAVLPTISEFTDPTAEQMLITGEQLYSLSQALSFLTKRERMALCLRDLSELSSMTVAKEMKCSQATVRSLISIARRKLKVHLGED